MTDDDDEDDESDKHLKARDRRYSCLKCTASELMPVTFVILQTEHHFALITYCLVACRHSSLKVLILAYV